MTLELARDEQGHLFLRQRLRKGCLYLIGLPLLAGGLFLAYGAVSSFFLIVGEQGTAGIPQAILGSLVTLVFAALVLPIGWWLVFSRHWIMLDGGTREIVEVSDWRLGRRAKRTPSNLFRAVRVAEEPLDSSPTGPKQSRVIHVQTIRLLAKEPDKQPSIKMGVLEIAEREKAIQIGHQVAAALNLKVEVAAEGQTLFSPAREQADKESE